jgi:DNA-binding NarL/FixJ family response regulator
VRIVIAEDSTLFREGLASLLADAGHEIVARVPDATTLMDAVRNHHPDLAIVDVRMPPDHTDDGARAAMDLRTTYPRLGILLLSQHIETTHSVHLVSTGAFGYLLKDRVLDLDDFLDALQRIASGGSALDPEVVTRLISMNSAQEPMHTLTSRERDVLSLMAQGHTNAGIARRLFLSQRTVETHIASLLAKLGIEPATHGHRRVLAVLAFLNAQT